MSCSCSRGNVDDARRDGDREVKRLVKVLRNVQCRDDLVRAESDVKRCVGRLVDVMVEIDRLKRKGETGSVYDDRVLGDVLQRELERVYAIDGGRELMEGLERDALHRLDAYERRVSDSKCSR